MRMKVLTKEGEGNNDEDADNNDENKDEDEGNGVRTVILRRKVMMTMIFQ